MYSKCVTGANGTVQVTEVISLYNGVEPCSLSMLLNSLATFQITDIVTVPPSILSY